ncbi:MAG: hypothetical protein OEV91_03850 [Desulfobulbaceae bacterium]|nr:hypothetical protein [Desulfobulbaceae bacterium]
MTRRARQELIPEELPILRMIGRELGHSEPAPADSGPDPYKLPMSEEAWMAALASFRPLIPPAHRQRFRLLALGLREGLLWSDQVMDRYCGATCGQCGDFCCSANGIYFDLADLLYLAGLDADLPMSQTRTRANAPCRYLSLEGCILPRMCRPFICTWYLCEPQMTLLAREPLPIQKQFTAIMRTVRSCRMQLVALYEEGKAADLA